MTFYLEQRPMNRRERRRRERLERQGKFWSVDQLADRWNISTREVWRQIETGKLAAARFGRRMVRVHDSERERVEAAAGFTDTA